MHLTHGRVRTLFTAVLVAGCAACSTPAAPQAQPVAAVTGGTNAASTRTAGVHGPPADKATSSAPTTAPTTAGPAEKAADKGAPTSNTPATRPADPEAPATIVAVVRDGAKPSVVLRAAAAPATAPIAYADGVSVRLASAAPATVQGRGPGVMSGAPVTLVTIEVRNASSRPLDLTRVVVTGRYGSPARLAAVTYVPQSLDFSGPVAPGASATAVYAVTYPSGLRRGDSLVVDLDAGHAPAVFLGLSA